MIPLKQIVPRETLHNVLTINTFRRKIQYNMVIHSPNIPTSIVLDYCIVVILVATYLRLIYQVF
jgi:hypothetical protein